MIHGDWGRRGFLRAAFAGGAALGLRRSVAGAAPPPIPELARWKEQMVEFGDQHGRGALADPASTFDQRLAATYYDAQRVFDQIGAYTGGPSWGAYAARAMAVYRDQYVLPNDGKVPGYWIFPHGLAGHFRRAQDPKSREAVFLLAGNAAFAADGTPEASTRDVALSREVAYGLMALLEAESLGAPPRPRLRLLVDQALGHIARWTAPGPRDAASYVRPFMVGLTCEALISYADSRRDDRVLPAILSAIDWIWDRCWVREAGAFRYTDRDALDGSGGTEPSPDLNLLIAPAYAWAYQQTGDDRHRVRGDAAFVGGVRKGYLGGPKQFNQAYRWSFDYVAWRSTPRGPAGR